MSWSEPAPLACATAGDDPAIEWPGRIFDALKAARIRQVCHVPDGGHGRLIELCAADPELVTTTLTTEEEGVAQACGAWLGGDRSVLLMQSSGVGNCINMLSMVRTAAFPFLAIVSMRGQWGEFVPWQIPMGQAAPVVLAALGVIVQPVDRAVDVAETIASCTKLAFDGGAAVAMLLGQRLISTKEFQQ
jgi:sulfopyruvate decarboxylase alpha subunit